MSRIARITLALTLFAQASVVAHACELPANQPAAAFDDNSAAPSHKAGGFMANTCLMHCTQAGQSASTHEIPAMQTATQAVLSVAPFEIRLSAHDLTSVRAKVSGPPQTVLYSRFLN